MRGPSIRRFTFVLGGRAYSGSSSLGALRHARIDLCDSGQAVSLASAVMPWAAHVTRGQAVLTDGAAALRRALEREPWQRPKRKAPDRPPAPLGISAQSR